MPILDLASYLLFILNAIVVPLIFAAAFLVFIWGVFQGFILNGGEPDKRKKGREFAAYGIVGFFLMLSIWGIVAMLTNTFGFDRQNRPPIPSFGAPTGSPSAPSGLHTRKLGESCRPPGPGCVYGLACNTRTWVCVHPEEI